MTETEFATWLRSVRHADTHADCVRIEAEINERQHLRDIEQGPYVPHGEAVHHTYGESRH